MRFDAVLFDCDGVLVDSEGITIGVLRDMLEELGSQTFMTGTDAELFSTLKGRAQFLAVDHGHVAPAAGS